MARYPDDVVQFIARHFHRNDITKAYALLREADFKTPRVLRAVLYLSNGSVSALRHYIAACQQDLRQVLIEAECVVGVAETPMPVRDMSLPLTHPRNVGDIDGTTHDVTRRTASKRIEHFHLHLLRLAFTLGKVQYRVAAVQRHPRWVRCYRTENNVVSSVRLPLAFVMEQVAEQIDLTVAS